MNERIVLNEEICHGKPVIRGTRMPVVIVLGSLAGGMTFEEIEHEYAITREDIQAAIGYAANILDSEKHFPIPA
jgi:uncharacterized protein (DUF433 family)